MKTRKLHFKGWLTFSALAISCSLATPAKAQGTKPLEYHIRPTDLKHEVLLPVGQEIEFKIKKNRMFVKALDGDRKARSYSIVAMKPANPEGASQSSSVNPSRP